MKCYYQHIGDDSCAHYASTCPRECTYHQYHIHTSVFDITDVLQPGNVHNLLQSVVNWTKNREDTITFIKRNIFGFLIEYKTMSKKVENYVPLVTPSGLIGTLGGSIGLCLGFSFVTAFEVIVFIYDYTTARWKVKARPGRV